MEDSKEAWMWVYSNIENTGLNMNEVVYLQIKVNKEANEVHVVAATTNDEEVVINTFDSGGEARDYLITLMNAMNATEGVSVRQ